MYASIPAPSILVGRDREFAVLRRQLAAALTGRGSLVLIGGEAGIGKTALAEAVCHEAAEQGALVLIGRCYNLTETPPYGPWVELFGPYERHGTVPLPDAFAQRGIVGAVTSQADLLRQMQEFFAHLSARRPVVLLLDDLHWADPASLDLLRALARSVATLPLLVIATYRSDALSRPHPLYMLLPTLVHEARGVRLDLHPLEENDVRELIGARYRLGPADAARLIASLQERAEGNPFFLGELLRTLEEGGTLRPTDDGWMMGDLGEIRVPPLLRQVIDGRLARLGEQAQVLLGVAAVIGQEVPLELWSTLASSDDEALLPVIERTVEAYLLTEMPDGGHVRFTHALIREAVYEGLSLSRRRPLHRRIAELLAARSHPDLDAVAMHFQRAGDPRAVEWLVRAGERAEKSFAWLTAAERYEAAIALLAKSDTNPDVRCMLLIRMAWLRRWSQPEESLAALDAAWNLAQQTVDPVLVAVCQHYRGIQRSRMGMYIEGLPDIEAAASAIDRLPVEAAASAIDRLPSDELARLDRLRTGDIDFDHERMWGSFILRLGSSGRTERAMALGLPMVTQSPPSAPLTDVHFGLAYAQAVCGEVVAARGSFAAARDGCRAHNNPAGVAETALYELECVVLPYATDALAERQALADEADAAWVQASGAVPADVPIRIAHLPLLIIEGRWDEAWELGLALRKARRYTSRRYLANRALGPLAFRRGDRTLAWDAITDTLPRGLETPLGDARFFDATILQRLAVALALDAGDPATAQSWLEAHDSWLVWSGAVLGKSEGQLLRAQYYRAIGDTGRASVHADRALAHANAPRQPLALLAAYRIVGELETEAKRFAGAATYLEVSLRLAGACAAPFERALTLLGLAYLRAASGQPDEGRTLLDEVRAICEPLGARPTLDRADALGLRLTARNDVPPAYPAGLSVREVEILRLVAAGRTNRQIAAMLSLSERTIHVHVRNIFTKTRTDNRAGATAFAFRHDLT